MLEIYEICIAAALFGIFGCLIYFVGVDMDKFLDQHDV